MKIFRSILGVVVGTIVAFVAIAVVQQISSARYPVPAHIKIENPMNISPETKEKLIAYMKTMPTQAFAIVLLSYVIGSFLGGGVSALIADRVRIIHAGIIGTLVLLATILNFRNLPDAHPDWMMIAAYVLPIPVSMLAGSLVNKLQAAPKLERL